ncbi:dermonecrotic toxin domain-containing protein [Pseudomonas vranovensis]|uniref:dermonecrotic toxin domain-containing protein n=1 Tax=Pseudomonas vranovensis TaxID=321661 RepID=UPI003D99B667
MSDLPEIPAPHSPVDFISAINHDTALLADASKRWKDHRDTFTTLLAQAPGVYQTLQDVVREQLGVDPLSTALRFRISDAHDSDVSLVALALHTRQYPQPPADLDQHAQVTAQGPNHPTLRLPPTQLLARLAQLDLPAAVRRQWDRYWQARAADTAVSRRTHAQNQYLDIFKASWDVALATGKFDRQQQRAVKEVLDNPEWHSQQGIEVQTVAIDGQAMPGALLFKTEDEPQLMLYRPGSGFSTHASQADLEAAIGATASSVSYESHDSLSGGFSPLFNSLLNERLSALDFKPGAEIREFGELALSMVHWVDTQQRSSSVFSLPPALESIDSEDAPQRSFYDFGSLNLDIPYSIRLQQINTQRSLMASIAETDLQVLKDHQQTLGDACQQAEQAIEQQLKADTWHQEQSPAANAALLQAHYHGLRAHARFQNLLGQIDNEELRWLESLLDQPDTFPRLGSSIVAAHPVLNTTSMDNGVQISTSTTLNDCLVVTLQDGDKPQSLLLYWPGEAGGLLRCANQAELTRCFAINDQSEQSLSLSPVTGDVLAVVLAHHLSQAKTALTTEEAPAAVKEALARRLQVPRHAAREYAFNLIQEQETSATLTGVPLNWLDKLSASDRAMLKAGTLGFIAAMHRAQALVARDLPHRELFCRQLISQRLKQDFPGYDDSPITLYLPESTSWVPIVVDSTSPQGIATKLTLKASDKWVDLTLDALLLDNIDEAMEERLSFLKLKLNTSNQALVQQLKDSIDKTYLSGLATDLDLAQQYENKITEAYRGTHESAFSRAYRRQCLGEPFRQMLIMHSAQARAKGELDDRGQTIFNIAIDADSKAAYQADGHDIELISARLSAGGEDTDSYGTTLSGVTFISDQNSGITVLYRPEHPTRLVRQYSSLEAARSGVYDLSKQSGEIDYLAGRALLGNPDAHRSRMRQAIEHRFDGIIGLGTTWPSTTSLAQHLLDAQGGRILEAHRATSRSNRDLWLENFAYQSGMIFNYIKMALGFIPVIGTVVAVYDFFEASARLVSALRQDEVYKALEALQQVLLAFVDAAIDLAPGLPLKALSARQLTRQRQLQLLQAGPAGGFAPGSARRLSRFEGYEYQTPLSLAGIEPGRHGKYKGIYQHAKGDFILVGDRPCQVQWLETEHTWRLRGTQFKTWRKNIALNENGQWDTHFALYGVHLRGGGSGGGQILGHMADVLEPYWPTAIREQLPRIWVDRHYRRQRMLTTQSLENEAQLQITLQRTNTAFDEFERATPQAQQALLETMKANCRADIAAAEKAYGSWDELQKISLRAEKQMALTQKVRLARVVCDRTLNLIDVTRKAAMRSLYESLLIRARLEGLNDLVDQAPLLRQLRSTSLKVVEYKQQMLEQKKELDTWFQRVTAPAQPQVRIRTADFKKQLADIKSEFVERIRTVESLEDDPTLFLTRVNEVHSQFNGKLTRLAADFEGTELYLQEVAGYEFLKSSHRRLDKKLNDSFFTFHNTPHLMTLAQKYANTTVIADFYTARLRTIEDEVHLIQATLSELQTVPNSAAQRRAIQTEAQRIYRQYKLELQSTRASFPELFDEHYLEKLYDNLDKLILHSDKAVQRLPGLRPNRGQNSSPRLFQAEDDHYYIGDYTPASGNAPELITVRSAEGSVVRRFEPVGERWRPQAPATPARPHELRDLKQTATQLIEGLDSFRRRVRGYIKPDTLPADLEDMMIAKANELENCATRIEAIGGNAADTTALRTQAARLRQEGVQLRIEQIKVSPRPNEGHLAYLDSQQQIGIRKLGERQMLKARDYLQEYEIRDLQSAGEPVLWYAHFHYRGLDTPFENFNAAHLKRAMDRKKGPEWQQAQASAGSTPEEIWRGAIRQQTATRYFSTL